MMTVTRAQSIIGTSSPSTPEARPIINARMQTDVIPRPIVTIGMGSKDAFLPWSSVPAAVLMIAPSPCVE